MKNQKSHWPYTIISLIILIIVACVVTVVQSLDFPVEDDYSYFDKYQSVENNFNEIQIKEEKFLSNFTPKILCGNHIELKNSFKKACVVKDDVTILLNQVNLGLNLDELKILAKLVRPHTTQYDMFLMPIKKEKTIEFDLKSVKSGRWQLMIQYSYGDMAFFDRIELFKVD